MQDIYIPEKISGPARYQSFFTDAEEINELMVSLIGDVSGCKILEPCAGQGAFIRPLLGSAECIDAIDIDRDHVSALEAVRSESLHVQEGDFIDYFVSGALTSLMSLRSNYDGIICNPPYGLKFSITYRKKIKSQFPEVYARESYGLFIVFGIRCLRDKGRFVFIVPDTFLTSRNHRSLREFLAANANITHLVQFDSARFESVNFGYGNLCILAGNRCSHGQSKDLKWLDYRRTEAPLKLEGFESCPSVTERQLREASDNGWTQCGGVSEIFVAGSKPLGELAECRTGIYTGDNPRFCGYDETDPPSRINGHPIKWCQVHGAQALTDDEQGNGLEGGSHYVPFIRGGHRTPFEETRSALDWSRDAVGYYRTDKKARLQNARFYFRRGLAVPMVTSGRLSASYMEGAVFDQGVVGVFPNDEDMLSFLLVFLNSERATELKRKINPGANNSANYLKRIQVPTPDRKQKEEASKICGEWRAVRKIDKEVIKMQATEFVKRNFLPA